MQLLWQDSVAVGGLMLEDALQMIPSNLQVGESLAV